MIAWILAGLLGMATGLRIGWGLVNQQSVVSSAMIVALGSLAVVAALNWPPLTLLVDTTLGWPNISVGLSQAALVASAAGSCVMITSVTSTLSTVATRRIALAQYVVAAVIAILALTLFVTGERYPEMAPAEYLDRKLGAAGVTLDWLVPLLYVLLTLTLVLWFGMRLSDSSRRGRALLLFIAGVMLIVAAGALVLIRLVGRTALVGVGTAVTMLLCAMAVIAAGALLPSIEDWIGSRRELRLIEPLRREMERRQPDVGIGVRPRGPLAFRVAEQLSLISDALYLESMAAQREERPDDGDDLGVPEGIDPAGQALVVAGWINAGRYGAPGDGAARGFPGRRWLSQPPGCSDRDWILEIARQYRQVCAR